MSHVRSQHGHSGPECFQCGQVCPIITFVPNTSSERSSGAFEVDKTQFSFLRIARTKKVLHDMPSPTRSLEYIEPTTAQLGAGQELSRFPLTDERVSRLWEEVQHGGAARLPREGVCSMSTSQVTYLYFYLYFCLYLYLYFHEKGCVEGRPDR